MLELDSIIVHLLLELLYTGSLIGGENELFEVNEAMKAFGICHLRIISPFTEENFEEEPKHQPVENENTEPMLEKQEEKPDIDKQEDPQKKKRHTKTNVDTLFSSLECPGCNKMFKTKSSLATHHKNKHENLLFS